MPIKPPDEPKVVLGDPMQPGFKTTEFWLTAVSQLAALAAQYQGAIPQPWGVIAAAMLGAVYVSARAYVKSKTATAAGAVAVAQAENS